MPVDRRERTARRWESTCTVSAVGSTIFNMNDSRLIDALGLLRWEVAQIEAGRRTIRRSGRDVTQSELGILKREIAFIEKVNARASEART
jgi:hypothetical protein